MDPRTVLLFLKLIDLVAAGLELAPDLMARKDAYVRQIEGMVKEGRSPSNDEMAELIAESDDITDQIREALELKKN